MPFSIPTYFASQFVKNSSLYERRKVLKTLMKRKMIVVSSCIILTTCIN